MKIEVDERGYLVLSELHQPIVLETPDKSRLVLTMRDGVIELTVAGSNRWYRADMDTGEIVEI